MELTPTAKGEAALSSGDGKGGEAMTADFERCPKCRDATGTGYGLAFGGFGAYTYCLNQACDWFVKEYECPVCEAVNCNEHEEART